MVKVKNCKHEKYEMPRYWIYSNRNFLCTILFYASIVFPFQYWYVSESPPTSLHIWKRKRSRKSPYKYPQKIQECQCDSPPLLPIGNASKTDTWPCDWVFPFSMLATGGLHCNNPQPGSSCISWCLCRFLPSAYTNGRILPHSSSFQLQNTS